jgi:Putative auto-transporter adhesin, head GIN domain
MKIRNNRLFLVFLFAITACNPIECFKTNGDVQKQSRNLALVEKIILQDNIDLYLNNQNDFEVVIKAGGNLIGGIQTDLKGTVLTIQNLNQCNWSRSAEKKIEVYLSGKYLQSIDFIGTGNIFTTESVDCVPGQLVINTENAGDVNAEFNAKTLVINNKNNSYVKLKGKANQLELNIKGYGKNECENMIAKNAKITHEGINDINVYATDTLNIKILNTGSVFSYNQPKTLIQEILGKGRINNR